MTTPFLSQHSSNPLEVSSSDIRNKNLLKQYIHAQAARRGDLSSDDPLAVRGEVDAYRTSRCLSKERGGRGRVVDLDEDMESDDELMRDEEDEDVVGQDEGDEEADGELQDDDDDDNDDDDNNNNHDDDQTSEDDEESSLLLKPSSERDEILSEISDLQSSVPSLSKNYKIIDRLGTGTFSSVYKALDLHYHSKWDNTPWHGHHPSSSSAYYQSVKAREGSRVFVAVKRIYVTSNPDRIRNEVAIMEDCRGCRHVSQLITAFRHEDQVVAIMPYHRNVDFRVPTPLSLIHLTRLIFYLFIYRKSSASYRCQASKPTSAVCSARYATYMLEG
jgi:cell division control protein 7